MESVEPSFDKDVMHLTPTLSALGSFKVARIATVSTVTLTLDTLYDPTPNKGLVVGDLIRVMKADGSTSLDTNIAAAGVNADGITVVLSNSAAAYAAGDYVFIRAATPSYTLLDPFLWARTQFCFADTAANALSATQIAVETGSKWKLTHSFSSKEGEHRSGSFDPYTHARTQAELQATIKMFYDIPDFQSRFLKIGGYALVVRHYSRADKELRITINNNKAKSLKIPLDTGKLVYQEYEFEAVYKTADSQAFDVKVINALAA